MSTPRKGPLLSSLVLALLGWETTSEAAVQCQRTLVANVVALDQPLMFNRLGAQNANGMMFALREDVVDDKQVPSARAGPLSRARSPCARTSAHGRSCCGWPPVTASQST